MYRTNCPSCSVTFAVILVSGRIRGEGKFVARTCLGISTAFLFFMGVGTSSKGLEDDPLLGVWGKGIDDAATEESTSGCRGGGGLLVALSTTGAFVRLRFRDGGMKSCAGEKRRSCRCLGDLEDLDLLRQRNK